MVRSIRSYVVSKSLQKETIELHTAIDLLKSLLKFLTSLRDKFDDYFIVKFKKKKNTDLKFYKFGKIDTNIIN